MRSRYKSSGVVENKRERERKRRKEGKERERASTTRNKSVSSSMDSVADRMGGPEGVFRGEKCSNASRSASLLRLQRCVLSEILIRHRPTRSNSSSSSSPYKGALLIARVGLLRLRIYEIHERVESFSAEWNTDRVV